MPVLKKGIGSRNHTILGSHAAEEQIQDIGDNIIFVSAV